MKQNQDATNMQKSANQPKNKRGQRKLWLILFLVLAALAVTVLFAATREISPAASIGGTFDVRRDNLTVTVQVAGSIKAHQSIQYKVQVQRGRDIGDVSILTIVPAGTYVTQEDVNNGLVLVQLDSSALEDRLAQEKIELTSDQESAVSAKETYDIQLIENESSIARSELDVRFALLDLQKYLGAELAEKLTKDVNEAVVNLSEYVAPFADEVKKDPNILSGSKSWQDIKNLQDQIVLAEGDLKQAQDTYDGTIRLHDANYVSDLELEGDRLKVVNTQFRAQNAQVNLDLFMEYDFPKNAEQYLSDYIEAGRNLQRTYAQCRSREAETKVRLNFAEQRLQEQTDRVKNFKQQIAYCTIRAKAPGLVVYGTGGEEDQFRAMRGRGGGMSSGIIAEGETVTEGQTLISMPDTKSMVAEVSVHETEVDKVRVGQPASIVMDAFPDQRLTGKVLEVAPLPDQQRGWMNPDLKVYKTLVSIDGTHDFLKSRMSCKVEILVRRLEDVILVPITVVANRGGRKVCYVMTPEGNRQERVVQTGLFNDTFVQIIDGLDVGEKVLLNPPLITETTATEDIFDGVQPLVSEPGASGNQGAQTGPGDQTGRGSRRGRRGAGMRGGEGMTPEQLQQLREKFGGQGGDGTAPTEEQIQQFRNRFGGQRGGGAPDGGGGPTEEQMQQFRNRFGSQGEGGTGGAGLTEEQKKQLQEKFQSGTGNNSVGGQNQQQQ